MDTLTISYISRFKLDRDYIHLPNFQIVGTEKYSLISIGFLINFNLFAIVLDLVDLSFIVKESPFSIKLIS
jgi:hypothetical protein